LPLAARVGNVSRVPAPTVTQSLGMGARAAWRSAWLAAPALLVALSRTALLWAAPVAALGIARGGALARTAAGSGARGVLSGAAVALAAPRTVALVLGLFLSGQLLAAALRAAYVAGALPVLGANLAGVPADRRFARGFGCGFARLSGTALLAYAVGLVAQLLALAWVAGAIVITAQRLRGGHPFWPALLVAAACLAAVLALTVVPLASDAALARASLAGERPGRALWHGARARDARRVAHLRRDRERRVGRGAGRRARRPGAPRARAAAHGGCARAGGPRVGGPVAARRDRGADLRRRLSLRPTTPLRYAQGERKGDIAQAPRARPRSSLRSAIFLRWPPSA
jgi:hypothetical protein